MIVAGTKMAARGEAGRDHVSEMFLRRRTMFCDSMEVGREKERCQEASATGRGHGMVGLRVGIRNSVWTY